MSDGGDERRAAMTAAAVQIAVRGLRKSFGRNRVLDGLDIDCGRGDSTRLFSESAT